VDEPQVAVGCRPRSDDRHAARLLEQADASHDGIESRRAFRVIARRFMPERVRIVEDLRARPRCAS
jgi:hypothetical protein